ncbi:MAG: hypothetical protein H6839_05905 [Planctomycetes bacterium]|nr:hypothetical protein [Planctomycetota bacterium]
MQLLRFTSASLLALFVLSYSVPVHAGDDEVTHRLGKSATSEDPDERARAVEDLCRINDKLAASYVLAALQVEHDGPAGFRMCDAVADLTDPDALKLISKTVGKWNTPETLMGAVWLLTGLAKQRSRGGDDVLGELADDVSERDVYFGSAYIEALASAGRTDFGHMLPPLLGEYSSKWDNERWMFALTVLSACPRMVTDKDNDTRFAVVLKLADILDQTKDDRIRWFTCKALADITGKPPYAQGQYWRWWVKVGGVTPEDQPEHEGKTSTGRRPPAFFDAEAVGKRVVFVIDVSGSMSSPVNMGEEPKDPKTDKKDGPVSGKRKGDKDDDNKAEEVEKPDYSGVVTKLDLAKVELIFTLNHLPEDYSFNIVTYGSTHSMLIQSRNEFVQATEKNKQTFIKKVEQLAVMGATNIHGALNRAFCINEKKTLDPADMMNGKADPASDLNCLLSGATTIFFLTDGSPNVSDEKNPPDRVADPTARARFTITENIIAEVRRLNLFRRAVIHTVGIGPHPKPLLQGLANATGGKYIDRSGQPNLPD